MARKPPEVLEMTEMIVLHGDSLNGSDVDRRAKLERVKEALREKEIDFVDQPEDLQVWVGTADREAVLATIEALGFKPDLYQV
jgi:hypothetical protein